MSPAMSALASVGITHSMMILAVLFVVAAVCIGMYWHIILPGAIMIGVATLFISPMESTTQAKPEVKQEVITEDQEAFMEDCTVIADYPKTKCEVLWKERQIESKALEKMEPLPEKSAEKQVDFKPVSHVELLDVNNVEYKARREEALKKPNAVILQTTLR